MARVVAHAFNLVQEVQADGSLMSSRTAWFIVSSRPEKGYRVRPCLRNKTKQKAYRALTQQEKVRLHPVNVIKPAIIFLQVSPTRISLFILKINVTFSHA